VSNQGAVLNDGATVGLTGYSVGDGASVSASATGAAASVGFSSIGSGLTAPGTTIGDLTQQVTNGDAATVISSNISNIGATMTVGDLTGNGSSVNVGGTGALASLSVSHINATTEGSFIVGAVSQTVNNTGTVGNSGTINAGDLTGIGSSASISGTGAAASVSGSSISTTAAPLGTPTITSITQTVNNNTGSAITNTGTINLAGGLGTGASASISATGAGGFASFRAVK